MSKFDWKQATIVSIIAMSSVLVQEAKAQSQRDAAVEEGEELVVTGTRIKSNANSPSPLSIIGSDQIKQAGTLSIADVLVKEPALGSATRGPSQTLNGGGSQGVDIRNLGNRRTLVLIDGRRMSIFSDEVGNATQDIGMIPSGLIKRVEVLKDGASATYGADAVAGVSNFILDSDFTGAKVSVYNGISSRGDGGGVSVSGTFGVGNDRGHIVLSGQYQSQDPIPQINRAWATNLITSIGRTSVAYNSPVTPGGTVLARTGATIACYPVGGGASLAPNCPRYSAAAESDLILGTKLTSVGALGHYDITDNIRFNAKAFYSTRDTNQRISAVQLDTSTLIGPFTGGILIPASSANNPYGQDVRFRWRLSNYGPAQNLVNSTQLWTTLGFSGKIFDRFDWDASYTRSQTQSESRRLNIPNILNLNNLLSPTLCAADALCRTVGAIPNIANLLSNATPLTSAQRDYLFFETTINSKFVTQQATATISGALFNLPAGEVQAAFGYEHRQESGKVDPDSVTRTTATGRSIVFPTDGRFSTNEVSGELQIPLLQDSAIAERLDLNLQGRYSHFSNFDGATTWKAGLDYQVIRGLRLRGSIGTSFRAPDVLELYGGGTGAQSTGGLDPCNASGLRATNTTVASNCAALSVPANFEQVTNSFPTRSGGNPSLRPERGRTYTFGTIVSPNFVPRLVITVDYYNIRVKDAILTGDLNRNLSNCYSDTNFLSRAADPNDTCYGYDQRSGGSLLRLNNPLLNLGTLRTSGIDFSVSYAHDAIAIPGELGFNIRGSWLERFVRDNVDYAGKFVNGVNGNLSYPRFRGAADITYNFEGFGARWTINYVHKMTDSAYGASVPADNAIGYSGTPAYVSNDLVFNWSSPWKLDFTVGMNNVFDRTPPYAFVSTRNTLPSTYDQIGRYLFVAASYHF